MWNYIAVFGVAMLPILFYLLGYFNAYNSFVTIREGYEEILGTAKETNERYWSKIVELQDKLIEEASGE